MVVMRSWTPPTDNGDSADDPEAQATDTLFEGLITGIMGADVPLVGVEPSDVQGVQRGGLHAGRSIKRRRCGHGRRGVALALLLAGGQPGHYGIKDSATDGAVPPIEPVTATTGG